ncbi:MAG: thrombospondin type 3 repeat-containing protein [Verrucomicrobia bacterium]|nr:thrombospondin type 3 repeat-containing protein [Verrucomicrobiota bacterium]
MPDGWEVRHELDPDNPRDAALDTDGDGLSNLVEYLSDTDPRDPQSGFRFTRIAHEAGEVQVEFRATPGRRYQVEQSAALINAPWEPTGAAVLAQSSQVNLTLPETAPHRFYRVSLLPP